MENFQSDLYGRMLTGILSFFNGKPMIAMENFQSDLSGRTGSVQVKSGMSIDSHLERCLLVQTAELYSPGKYGTARFKLEARVLVTRVCF